jgi:photosystem II stability/assembly factor-like uncharacterized protein
VKSKSIGSLIVLAILAPSCGGGGGGSSRFVVPPNAFWATQQRVPTSSDLRSVIFSDLATGIVGGKDGAIFRTDDGGNTWLQEDFTPASRTGDIAVIGGLNLTLVAVGKDAANGLSRYWTSTNGLTWSTADVPATNAPYTDVSLASSGGGPTPVASYRLRSDGILDFTLADGTSGSNVTGTWTNANGMAYLALQGFGYVCGDNGGVGQIRRTQDGGANWNTAAYSSTAPKTLRRIVVTPTLKPYACGDNSTNNGIVLAPQILLPDTWDQVTGAPGGLASLQAIFFPVDETLGWVVGNGGTIYRISIDTSTIPPTGTWVDQNPGFGVTTENLYAVYFTDNDHGWIVGDNGTVLHTVNGSAATGPWWAKINRGDAGINLNAAAFNDYGSRGIAVGNAAAGNAAKIYRTMDGGATWAPMPSTLGTQNLLGASVPRFGAGTFAYICGDGGVLMQNSNVWGSGTWTQMAGTTGTDVYRAILFPQGEDKGICVGSNGAAPVLLRLNTAVSASWTAPATPAPTAPSASYNALSANLGATVVYASGGANGVVSRSSDLAGGWNVWTDLAPPTGLAVTLPAVQSPEGTNFTAFAAASDGKVYRLSAGMTPAWTAAAAPWGAEHPVSLGFQGDLHGMVVTDAGKVYYTLDSGTSWTLTYPHTRDVPRALWMSPNYTGIGYIVCNNGTIMKTWTSGH